MLSLNKRDIKRAYKITGLEPIKGDFYRKGGACPIGVLALANGVVSTRDNLKRRADKADNWCVKLKGKEFTQGFVDGFDSQRYYNQEITYNDKYYKGHALGESLAKELELA